MSKFTKYLSESAVRVNADALALVISNTGNIPKGTALALAKQIAIRVEGGRAWERQVLNNVDDNPDKVIAQIKAILAKP